MGKKGHSNRRVPRYPNVTRTTGTGRLGILPRTPIVVQPDYWSAPEPKELKFHKDAPKQHDVVFTQLVKAKIDTLMMVYPNIEWLCYLSGKREGNITVVDDIIIPTQTVTSVRVDSIELDNMGRLPIIGVMHSHHGMGNGFSGTDDEYINANHLLSLCISHGGINGQFRWETPEKDVVVINADVKIRYDFEFNRDEFVKHCKKEISEVTYNYLGGNIYGHLNDSMLDDITKFNQRTGCGTQSTLKNPPVVVDEEEVPEICSTCESSDIVEVPENGWFCVKCGNGTYDDELDTNITELSADDEVIGFDDVPENEQQSFDGVDSNWKSLDKKDEDYPLPPAHWREADELGYIQCEECYYFHISEDIIPCNHPTRHNEGDEIVTLCKDCYCGFKYNKDGNKKQESEGWDTKSQVNTNSRLIQCASCKEHHDYIDNYGTEVGNLCEDCYTNYNDEKQALD